MTATIEITDFGIPAALQAMLEARAKLADAINTLNVLHGRDIPPMSRIIAGLTEQLRALDFGVVMAVSPVRVMGLGAFVTHLEAGFKLLPIGAECPCGCRQPLTEPVVIIGVGVLRDLLGGTSDTQARIARALFDLRAAGPAVS